MENTINNVQADILELLAKFKFLTISQITPLINPERSVGYIRTQLAGLTKNKYIKAFALAKPTKAEHMYHLTEAGKLLIIEHAKAFPENIKLPVGEVLLVRDFAHRKATVSVTIALTKAMEGKGITILSFDSYFDKTGSNNNRNGKVLEAKTKIPMQSDDRSFFIPDSIMVTESNEQKSIYLIEMFCDASATRVMSQLETHVLASAQGAPGTKLGIRVNPIVISAFQYPNVMKNVMEKFRNRSGFEAFIPYFFFGLLDEITLDAAKAFKTVNKMPLLPN